MMTFVLSFFSTFSSAAEKNSALSPSLISPSTYRIVKLSVCFFSTIKPSLPERGNHRSASKLIAMSGSHRHHRVHPAEAERVGEKHPHRGLPRLVWDVIEVARRIGRHEVDRRRDEAGVDCEQRRRQLERA